MNKNNSDEYTGPSRSFLESLYDTRLVAKDTKFLLTGSTVNPTTPFITNQSGHSPDLAEAHKANTSALIDYRDHLLPRRNHTISDLWREELDTITISNTQKTVSLEDLDEFDAWYITHERQLESELSTGDTEQETLRVWIPLKPAFRVFRQLEECLHELGWAPDPKTPESKAGDSDREVPELIIE